MSILETALYPFRLADYAWRWLLRCRACSAEYDGHYPSCSRLWRNGGEITGSGDAWYKAHGYPRDWAEKMQDNGPSDGSTP